MFVSRIQRKSINYSTQIRYWRAQGVYLVHTQVIAFTYKVDPYSFFYSVHHNTKQLFVDCPATCTSQNTSSTITNFQLNGQKLYILLNPHRYFFQIYIYIYRILIVKTTRIKTNSTVIRQLIFHQKNRYITLEVQRILFLCLLFNWIKIYQYQVVLFQIS